MTVELGSLFAGQVFAFMMVFTRISAGLMLFPGIGEAFVPARIRMMFAFVLAVVLTPVLKSLLPPMPQEIAMLIKLILFEVLVGAFFGVIMRLMVGIIETAGAVIAFEIGLSNAMVLNPTQGQQSALTAALLSTVAITLIFVTGLDALLFRSLVNTYEIFPVGKAFPLSDVVPLVVKLTSKCVSVGVQLAAPFIVVGLLIYSTVGIMQKLMPQIQLFLVMLPVQIAGGIFVIGVCATSIFAVWLTVFDDTVGQIFWGG